MRVISGLVVLALTVPAFAAQPQPAANPASAPAPSASEHVLAPQSLIVRVSGSGQVTEARYQTEAPEALRTLVEKAVRSWQFTPYQQDGKPVDWATRVTVNITAVPLSDGRFALKVTRVGLWNFSEMKPTPPYYPHGIQTLRKPETICTRLKLSKEGSVAAAEMTLLDGSPLKAGDPFGISIRDAFKNWKLAPLELDGVDYGVESTITMRMTFYPPDRGVRSTDEVVEPMPTCPMDTLRTVGTLKLLSQPEGSIL